MTFLDFSKVIAALGPEELMAAYDRETADQAFREWLVYNSGVYLNYGTSYGAGGEGHVRLNVASSRLILNEAFDAIAAAIRNA
jgi:bifunctional pyridoxal-dependent enzyme with beta-cystathionase and maltose regulon repressor activities